MGDDNGDKKSSNVEAETKHRVYVDMSAPF